MALVNRRIAPLSGVGEQRHGMLGISRIQRNADAQVDLKRMAINFNRTLELGPHRRGEQFRTCRQGQLVRDPDELVTANACHIRPSCGFLQSS
jgi:hypothetical protein